MSGTFDSFVIFAGMRTGSNFLESSLNSVPGVTCHGEAFNPVFIGFPERRDLLGITQAGRDADPGTLLAALKVADGLNGFRYFHDHDPRILDRIIADRSVAKIILTRNPLDSFISLGVARATGQWKLGHVRDRKEARIAFDERDFADHLDEQAGFHRRLIGALQAVGQGAFLIDYEDLGDPRLLNGLLAFLGVAATIDAPSTALVRQNPGDAASKVSNPDVLRRALADLDPFGQFRLPDAGPRRGPAVPSYVTATGAPLLYQPIRGAADGQVRDWLATLTMTGPPGLNEGFTQNSLRHWMQANNPHRSFTVVTHPALRSWRVFRADVLTGRRTDLCAYLRAVRNCLPKSGGPMTDAELRAAYLGFLQFIRQTMDGQTAFRVEPAWATQAAAIEGFSQFVPPGMIAREATLQGDLQLLCQSVGAGPCPDLPKDPHSGRDAGSLAAIWDDDLHQALNAAYRRDMLVFGFGRYAA